MERHANIPIFIPHEGCPNNCVFCNQHTITGVSESADRDITPEIESALATFDGKAENIEIAFFGGSFTGIDRTTMIRLLKTAFEYVKSGKVSAIRLSTRPDYINGEILDILEKYGVTDIELGLQSMRDGVLEKARRGHTAYVAEEACRLIKSRGFNLVGQMMIGLPGSTAEDEAFTAKKIVDLGCDGARIYPTVVFENTELCDMAKCDTYTPLTVDEAVGRSVVPYEIFVKGKVKVLRIGLQATEALVSGDGVYAGANHSALGELVIGEYYLRRIYEKLSQMHLSHDLRKITILCAESEQSKVSGQKKTNKAKIADYLAERGVRNAKISILSDKDIQPNEVRILI